VNASKTLFPLRCVFLLAGSLIICACGSSLPSAPLAPGGAATVYVVENYSTILAFSASSNGAVTPVATLDAPAGLENLSIATDSAGAIYVAGEFPDNTNEVAVYAPGSSGAAVPIRILKFGFLPYAIAVDSVGRLYITGDGSTAVYSSTASGTQPPDRLLMATGISNAIAADSKGTIYLGSYSGITVYPPGATGITVPARSIDLEYDAGTIAIDSDGDIFTTTATGDHASIESIVELGPTATGTSTPIRSFTTPNSSGGLLGLQMDAKGNIYVFTQSYTPDQPRGRPFIYGFGPTASGNVEPGVKISSTSLTAPTSNLALH
jgi:hypothetical protein